MLPAAFSTGIGSQVQKPLALVVVGGILLAPVLILIVLPVLIDVFSRRASRDLGDMEMSLIRFGRSAGVPALALAAGLGWVRRGP